MKHLLHNRYFSQKGFTLQELLVIMAIMAILIGIATMSLVTIQNRANINASLHTFVSEMKLQQIKAMTGDTEGRSNPDRYGIYFEPHRYTLFHGSTYNPNNSSNYVINLEDSIEFSTINLPNQSLIFEEGSGNVVGYNPTQASITIQNIPNNETKTITFNKYGVIVQIQ